MLTYNEIKDKYGHRASWAIWKKRDPSKKAKFGIGDISFFDFPEDLHFNPNIILCGLNISRKIEKPFANFHSEYSTAHDYKIRFATEDSIFTGAYMTDVIKDFEEVMSGKVIKYLDNNPNVKMENIKSFEKELQDIGSTKPIIIAFGNDCEKILQKELKEKYNIYKVPHYSSCISKEKLRDKFNEISKLLLKI